MIRHAPYAIAKEMVESELDREAYEDGGYLTAPVRMADNLAKCVDRKNLKTTCCPRPVT